MGNPPAPPGTRTTRLDPAIRSRAGLMLSALPFVIIAVISVFRMVIGPGWSQPGASHRMAELAFLAVAGVTVGGVLTSWARGRRDRELAQVRLAAEAAQQVLLRPVPRQAGPVRLAGYLSASSGARVGGDLYEVMTTPECVRFEPGDALLFYTDGASEARNKAGVFFPLADCAAVHAFGPGRISRDRPVIAGRRAAPGIPGRFRPGASAC
jgi:hypothetical protein